MNALAFASSAMLAFGLLAFVADPAAACPSPTSGTGLATCQGTAFVPGPSTTGGPACWNTLCPWIASTPSPGPCAQVWLLGDAVTGNVCVPLDPREVEL